MRHLIKYLAATALLLTAALPIQAQEDNAAFYIYQNDGHFDGFFYDQVQKISYSKLDTLGVEHEDFVSQEIITNDSIYRIMLTAIDSVGFVQPEIILNPKLKVMEDIGLLKYCWGINEQGALGFQNLPDELSPEVGDILVCYKSLSFFPEGFGGKVTNVIKLINGWTFVYTEPLEDFSDVFIQFITVEDYGYDQDTQQVRVRRVAGMKGPQRASGEFNGTLFRISAHPHLQWIKGDATVSLDLNANLECRAKAVWNFSFWGSKYFKIDMKEKIDLGFGATLDYKIKAPLEAETKFGNLAPIWLPAAAPILRVILMPEGFIRSELHATGQVTTPSYTMRAAQSIEFKDWTIIPDMTFGDKAKFDDEEEDNSNGLQFSGSINGFVHAGAKWPFVIRTNDIFRKVLDAEVGMNVYAGPKLSGEFNFNLNDLGASILSGNPTKLYNSMKDSKFSFSPFSIDYELKSLVSYLSYKGDTLTILDGTLDWTSWDYYMFPKFDEPQPMPQRAFISGNPATQFLPDGKDHYTINIKPSRDMVIGGYIGAALFRGDSLVGIKYDESEPYSREKTYNKTDGYSPMLYPADGMANVHFENRLNYSIYQYDQDTYINQYADFVPGEYTVYPVIRMIKGWGPQIICEPSTKFEVPAMYLEVDDAFKEQKVSAEKKSVLKIPTRSNVPLKWEIKSSDKGWYSTTNMFLLDIEADPNPSADPFNMARQRERLAYSQFDTLVVEVGRNLGMIPIEREITLEANGYNGNGDVDTLHQYINIKQPAYNIFEKMDIEIHESDSRFEFTFYNIQTGNATTRSDDIITCNTVSGIYPNGPNESDTSYEINYKCDVIGEKILSGKIKLKWSFKSNSNQHNYTFETDLSELPCVNGTDVYWCSGVPVTGKLSHQMVTSTGQTYNTDYGKVRVLIKLYPQKIENEE